MRAQCWWVGWVAYSVIGYDGVRREGVRFTDWDFSTAGQAQRAADALAGAMAAPHPRTRHERRWRSKTQKLPSRITVTATGASRTNH